MSSEYHSSTQRSESLEDETRTTIEEARMVLPGIQALFGFQLVAVFNGRFQDLTGMEQVLHLVALLMVAVAVALIMTPAAYHRMAERGTASRRFVDLASRFIECAMFPLMFGSVGFVSASAAYSQPCPAERRGRDRHNTNIPQSLVRFSVGRSSRAEERIQTKLSKFKMENTDLRLLSNLPTYGDDGQCTPIVETPESNETSTTTLI